MSDIGWLFEIFFLLCGLGAVGSFLVPERWTPALLAAVSSIAAVLLFAASTELLLGNASLRIGLWPILSLGRLTLSADRLSAIFLLVSSLVFFPVSLFSSFYLRKYLGHYSLRYFSVLYHALFASIVLVLIADDAVAFVIAWEAMSIVSYLLVAFEYEREESSQAAFVMLAMSEAGTIAVVIAFILVAVHAGTFEFDGLRAIAPALGEELKWAVLLLSFFGFAVKAGLVPVNSWLPLAHPVAPTNVSALLSAVIVNLGIYGIIRFNLDLVPVAAPGAGLVVLVTGSISALVGILYATIQAEMKRLLAHSTIENMGIVAAGIGAAMVFLATDHHVVASIALLAALYHLTNHSVYKALLFLGTGAVEAGTGTRDLDRLGGIGRHMPWTSGFFLVGVLSISALPPLNGFVSEWLTLQTILRSTLLSSTLVKIIFAVCGALLALTAGLAVTCFAKVFAMGFLGMPRSQGAVHAVEAKPANQVPLALLAATCVLLGVLPTYVIPVLDRASTPLTHASATTALVPPFFSETQQRRENLPPKFLAEFRKLGADVGSQLIPGRGLIVLHRGEERNPVVFAMSTSYMVVVLALLLALSFVAFRLLTRKRTLHRAAAWAGGLRRLTPGITYTASGFSNPVRVVFQAVLHPAAIEDNTEAVARHFRTAIRREYTDVHIVDRLLLGPLLHLLRQVASVVRKMHVGNVNAYAAYIFITLLIVLIVGTLLL
ncbi:MAG: proton-conducting transporter membrane subunit [Methylovirgula sp.]